MRVFKPILISSLTVPVLVFLLFLSTSLIFLVMDLFTTNGYSGRWRGLLYAGLAYTYFAGLVSSIPTILLGLPATIIAGKYGLLTKKVVMAGAPILGALFLSIVGALLSKSVDLQAFLWFMLAGGIGGLINGYAFLRASKESAPN